jgi:hypothetical protein
MTLAITLLEPTSVIDYLVIKADGLEIVMFGLILFGGTVSLVWNSWVTSSWYDWDGITKHVPFWILAFFRFFSQPKILNSYGNI